MFEYLSLQIGPKVSDNLISLRMRVCDMLIRVADKVVWRIHKCKTKVRPEIWLRCSPDSTMLRLPVMLPWCLTGWRLITIMDYRYQSDHLWGRASSAILEETFRREPARGKRTSSLFSPLGNLVRQFPRASANKKSHWHYAENSVKFDIHKCSVVWALPLKPYRRTQGGYKAFRKTIGTTRDLVDIPDVNCDSYKRLYRTLFLPNHKTTCNDGVSVMVWDPTLSVRWINLSGSIVRLTARHEVEYPQGLGSERLRT